MSEHGDNAPPASSIGSGQGYNINLHLVYSVMCVMDLLIETAISMFVSISEYIVPRSVMLICVMVCEMFYFKIKICQKNIKYSTLYSCIVIEKFEFLALKKVSISFLAQISSNFGFWS
jgi:hypothetical protein